MSQMQKPVLEHTAPEAQNPQVTGDTLAQNSDVVKSVTCTGNGQVQEIVRQSFVFEVSSDRWDHPDKIRGARVWLPNGLSAWFCRIEEWEERPYRPLSS